MVGRWGLGFQPIVINGYTEHYKQKECATRKKIDKHTKKNQLSTYQLKTITPKKPKAKKPSFEINDGLIKFKNQKYNCSMEVATKIFESQSNPLK